MNLMPSNFFVFCRTHMQDLQEVTHEIHYENYRSEKLQLKKFIDHDEKQKKLIQEKYN